MGKRRGPGPAAFLANLETEVLRLERELRSGTWRPGGYVSFEIRDPKRRTISAAPFRDRVVHHAVHAVIAPLFERGFIDHTYANRAGKGISPTGLTAGACRPTRHSAITTLLADALAVLHEAGYVHGDVKPSNIGFAVGGTPKLLDFGLARASADAAGRTLRYLVARGSRGTPGRRGRRRLVVVRGAARDGDG